MSLLDSYMERCFHLTADQTGGSIRWEKGAAFDAAILFGSRGLNTPEPEEPDHLYCSVTLRSDDTLQYGEMFLRERDGKVYRVLSEPGEIAVPGFSGLNMSQYRAERYGAANILELG